MGCYHPLKAALPPEGGKPIIYKNGQRPQKLASGYEPIDLACGQCIGCRIDKSKEWAARIVHESQMHHENTFVTLTYDEKNLPYDGSLNKAHFQKFMKRLRKHFNDKPIRYFHCGEYGEDLARPHYHACLFGIDFADRVPHSSSNEIITYKSALLQKIWGKGFCTTGELNYQTAAYTARYVLKKVTGKKAELHYEKIDLITGEIHKLQPEYITMSLGRKRGQGIGGTFYEKYQSDFFPRDECPIPGKGVYKKIPKYYDTLYAEQDPETWEQIKTERKKYREKHAKDYTPQRLAAEETVKKAQLKQLRRHNQ